MKLLILLISLLSFANAYATPKVGDYVSFESGSAPSSNAWLLEKEITRKNGNKYEITETVTSGASKTVKKYIVKAKDLLTGKRLDHILSNCEKLKGSLEDHHLPIGTLTVCKFSKINSEKAEFTSFFKVPFGIADYAVQTQSSFSFISLKDYRWGQ